MANWHEHQEELPRSISEIMQETREAYNRDPRSEYQLELPLSGYDEPDTLWATEEESREEREAEINEAWEEWAKKSLDTSPGSW